MDNPNFIVNGFIRSGITPALDNIEDLDAETEDPADESEDTDESESDMDD